MPLDANSRPGALGANDYMRELVASLDDDLSVEARADIVAQLLGACVGDLKMTTGREATLKLLARLRGSVERPAGARLQ